MLNLLKAKEKLKEHQEAQDNLVTNSQNILRGQADLLCQALQQLKRRSEAGQQTAKLIWNSLIDGITAEIPDKFFYTHASPYFWGTCEHLSNDELAFRKLLEQVSLKKSGHPKGKTNDDNKKSHGKSSTGYANVTGTGTWDLKVAPAASFSSKICSDKNKEETDDDDDEPEELLQYLVAILKVAAVITSPTLWEWRKEDDTLRQEVQMFNESLKVAMDLFSEIHNTPDLSNLIESLEKVSLVEKRETLRLDYGDDDQSLQKFGEEQGHDADDNGQVFDSRGTEVNSDQAIDMTTKKSEPVSNQKGNVRPRPDILSLSEEAQASKLDGEDYIIRHARSKLGGQPLSSKFLGSDKCDHAGYKLPASHYRDWRRDGFRCTCGQKFRLLNTMDRHIYTQQLLRILACDQCDYKASRKCCMEKHKRDNHNKPKMLHACRRLYQCMFGCEGVLKSKAELLDHQKMTDRQCKYSNAMVLPMRQFPTAAVNFVGILKKTCDRNDVALTKDRMCAILAAVEKDATRLRKIKEEKRERVSKP